MSAEPKKTASRCTTVASHGTHTFEIVGYSLKKGMGVAEYVQSGTFAVGGCDWAISFYPDGSCEDTKEYVAIFLELLSSDTVARASYILRLVSYGKETSGVSWSPPGPRLFDSSDLTRFGPRNSKFILRSVMEEPGAYIRDDRLTVECEVTVIRKSLVSEKKIELEFDVPPPNITEDLGKLLMESVEADVTFSVARKIFKAHKLILAMRSPVFKAELYGPMRETTTMPACITIEEMQPEVFEVLLHFIYTDSLPKMDDLTGEDYSNMIWHLLAAADRYGIERLKLICQSIIRKGLGVNTVATTMALADQHQCDKLKDACVEFFACSSEIDAVVESQGYISLKRTCPAVCLDLFEKASKLRKI